MKIEDSVFLVTGANRGLGLAFVRAALEMGAKKIYAAARDPRTLEMDGVIPIRLDITDETDIASIPGTAPDVTVLINNAGIYRPTNLLDDDCLETVENTLNTNLIGTLSVSRSVVPIIIHNGGGTIVNILSAGCWLSGNGNLAYSVSKAAALSLTNNMRVSLNSKKIQVVAVHAGFIDTDMMKHFSGKKLSPDSVARDSLLAIQEGSQEVLVDDMSKQAKTHSALDIPFYV